MGGLVLGEPVERPPHVERLISVTGRFAKRVGDFSLIPAVCATILLAACGSGTASATSPERVPAAARVLMVTYAPATDPPLPGSQPARPVSVTVTDLARVRQAAGLIHGLSLAPPGQEWLCPVSTDGVLNLAFRTSVGGRTLAAAHFTASGCPAMDLTVAGVKQEVNISATFTSQVLQIAGIRATTAS
jgi:hypothetical protein